MADVCYVCAQNGASTEQGKVLVSDHIPKVKVCAESCCMHRLLIFDSTSCNLSIIVTQDFFQKECWAHHPKPYADYMDMKQKEDAEMTASRKKLIPGMA